MPEFNLDNLKTAWKEQKIPHRYTEGQILDVLNHSSKNSVKYILWIGILEFLIIFLPTIFYIITGEREDFSQLFEKLHIEKNTNIQNVFEQNYFLLKILSLILTGIFVIRFYLDYKAIKIESKLTVFIHQLLKFRRTVRIFIWLNISIIVISVISSMLMLYNAISSKNGTHNEMFFAFVIAALVSVVLIVFLAWLYYRIVYGILLKRLNKHLNDLQAIELENKLS